MKKSVNIVIICILIAALITGGVVYLIYQTRDDELLIGSERAEAIALLCGHFTVFSSTAPE